LPRHGSAQVAGVQRSRILGAAVAVVSQYGYSKMTVSRVTGRAGVSRRTFYDLFEDRDDCFLAVFEDAVTRVRARVVAAYATGGSWRERTRAGLAALLGFFEEEPAVCSLLVVDALRAGPVVQRRRAEILRQLATELRERGSRAGSGRELPPLTGEGVVGAVLGVVHTRLSSGREGRLSELLNPLMAIVVLPYLGPAAAQRELERPAPKATGAPRRRGRSSSSPSVSAATSELFQELPMRLTYRTLRVLSAIAEQPGASNRMIGDAAGASDQGQISKLLARLQKLGLVANSGQGQAYGEANAWRLTVRGEEVQAMTGVAGSSTNNGPSRGSRRGERGRAAS
jgi:AcrR family transcriptional regulator